MPSHSTLADGVIVVDKPQDVSSAQVVARVKRILGVKKAGHTGTLDPFATGVLVCCFGRATRLARFFLHGDKRYEACMRLGVETDTQDLTGQVTAERPVEGVTEERFKEVLSGFVGDIEQAPPVYSALKHNGVPLYKLARQGRPVQKEARKISIHSLDFISLEPPMASFSASCSGGTYIRTLCADIGGEMGCGAHLHALRRTENSGFTLEDAVSLDQLENLAQSGRLDEHVTTMNDALRRMPEYMASRDTAKKITHGSALTWLDLGEKPREASGAQDRPGRVKVVDAQRNLLAVLTSKPDGVGLAYDCVFPPPKPSGARMHSGQAVSERL